jgi:hypothetical protein
MVYALWSILLFNGLAGLHRSPPGSFYFWLYGGEALFFGFVWPWATLSRLREFGWSLWWAIALVLPWCGLIWALWRGRGIVAISVFAFWLAVQSMLVLKRSRSIPDPKEVQE